MSIPARYNAVMRTIPRNDHSPRVELLPLIDVIFLLITFFIYSFIVWDRAQLLPVELSQVQAGEEAKPGKIHAITIDRDGRLFLDRQPISETTLEQRLAEIAKDPEQPALFLAVEQQGDVDRAPAFINLVDKIHAAGVAKFFIVGQPKPAATGLQSDSAATEPGGHSK